MNEFKFNCPHCQQHLLVAETLAGRQFQCPGCNHLIRVPRPPGREDTRSGTVESGRTWDTILPSARRK
jgi:transcription elongation factor Elf1